MSTPPNPAPTLELRPLKPGAPGDGAAVPFLLSITPPSRKDPTERPRLNLALVIDRSGSMVGQPLEQARLAAQQAVGMLGADDRVAVVAFDHRVDVVVPSTPAADRIRIGDAVRRVQAGGTTALHAGWVEGSTQVAHHLDPEALNRVVLLTDGLANVGETSPDVICGDVAGLKAHGVTTSALGLGRSFHEDLLEGMAEAGGGNFYLVESPDALRGIFAAELRGLSATVGTEVRLAFRPNGSGAAVAEVLNDLREEGGEDGGALVLPDLIAGLPIEIGGTLRVPALPLGEAELGTLHLRWRDPKGEPFELEAPVRLEVLEPAAWAALPEDPEVASLHAELRAARLKGDATRALDRGDRAAASGLLDQARLGLSAAPQTQRIRREIDEFGALDAAMSAGDDAVARKRMKAQAYRKRRSFYHERLEEPQAQRPAPAPKRAPADRLEIRRADGSVGVLELALGDLTDERADAILNPTNPGLFGTGRTVDGAVHRRGGRGLTRACRDIGRVGIGQAVVTPGFRLPARFVLHTAVPTWDDGSPKAAALLAGCYRSALALAGRMNLRTLSVPMVGAGSNGFPPEVAARVALEELTAHLQRSGAPERVRVVLFEAWGLELYRRALGERGKVA